MCRPICQMSAGDSAQLGLAAHVRLKCFGDGYGAIGLKVVLQEGNEHTGRGNAGVVQGVCQSGFAVLVLVADLQAACLCVTQIGAGADLKVLLLTGGPGFDVALFTFRSAKSPEQHSS